jgi:hypothetical protein
MNVANRNRFLTCLLVLAACFPIFLALHVLVTHWVNIPIWDEWDTPGIAVVHAASHTLHWPDLLAQHNESRKVIPRLICIAMAWPAGWDVRHAMLLTFASLSLISAVIFLWLRRQRAGTSTHGALFAWVIVNFLLFAPSEYENLLSGFVFEILIPVLCLFGCIAVNLSRRRLPEKVALNSILALLATYTFAHGMLLWPLALPIPRDDERSRRNWMRAAAPWHLVYLLVAVASISCYFIGYKRPDVAPPPPKLSEAFLIIDFVRVWLGAVLQSAALSARMAGTVAGATLLLTVSITLFFLHLNKARWKFYYPWLLLAAFSIGSGLLTAVGRVNLGVDLVFNPSFYGFSSIRYNATSVFAYVATIGMLFNLSADAIRTTGPGQFRFVIGTGVLCTFFGFAWIGTLTQERARLPLFQENRKRARTAAIWSSTLPDNPEIFAAYPYPAGFSERVEEMKRLSLLKIPEIGELLKRKVSLVPSPTAIVAGYIDGGKIEMGDKLSIAGWARNPNRNTRADFVILGWEDPGGTFHPFTALATGGRRPDLIEAFSSSSIKNAGFNQAIDISKLPKGTIEIKGWSIDLKTQEAFPLSGSFRLERPF